MPWPVHPTGFFGARGDSDTYRIERSLRFNSADSAYLTRTFSGTPYTYTLSWWAKRGLLSTAQIMFGSRQGASNPSWVEFQADNTIRIVLGVNSTVLTTTSVFRDTSAWYHFVLSVTASGASYFYVNGVQAGTWTSSATPYLFNSAYTNAIGRYGDSAQSYFDGYMAEVNFIDGQALAPSSFGELSSITGRWKAKAYGGTYGTDGFYLSFKDNTSTTTLGYDDAGSNDWTLNNFSVTAGAGNDSLVDSPTDYGSDTGIGGEIRGNYSNINPNDSGLSKATLSNGNLDATSPNDSSYYWGKSTQSIPTTGGWYAEITIQATGSFPVFGLVPITKTSGMTSVNYVGELSNEIGWFGGLNGIYQNGSSILATSALANSDVIMIAHKEGKTWFGKNGAWLNSGDPSAGTGNIGSTLSSEMCFAVSLRGAPILNFNFGQRPFSYTAPSGFKVLCTQNLTQPTIQNPNKYMDVLAYTGTGASNTISSFGFSPNLVWIKNRGTTTDHAIYDTTRGTQAQLSSNTTSDEVTSSTGLTSFDSNGFTVGTSTLVNTSGTQYVAWAWDESVKSGLDIISYTGNGANRTISHNLGVAPKMIIVKARTTSGADQGWPVYHGSLANTEYLLLNSTAVKATGADYWNSTSPTSSVFSIGTNSAVNTNNDNYIAYAFFEVDGFSKFGSYAGNNSTDGPFAWCGFRPRYIILKSVGVGPWSIFDSSRNTSNVPDGELRANTSEAENGFTFIGDIDLVSNGFKIRSDNNGSWFNPTGNGIVIFAAFAESPFKYARAR